MLPHYLHSSIYQIIWELRKQIKMVLRNMHHGMMIFQDAQWWKLIELLYFDCLSQRWYRYGRRRGQSQTQFQHPRRHDDLHFHVTKLSLCCPRSVCHAVPVILFCLQDGYSTVLQKRGYSFSVAIFKMAAKDGPNPNIFVFICYNCKSNFKFGVIAE